MQFIVIQLVLLRMEESVDTILQLNRIIVIVNWKDGQGNNAPMVCAMHLLNLIPSIMI